MSGTRKSSNNEFEKQTLQNFQEQNKTVAYEPVSSAERIRELKRQLQEKEEQLAGMAEEKSSAPLQPSKELRFQFIEDHRSEFRVEKMCSVLEVSRSGYYKWRTTKPSPQAARKALLLQRITYHFNDMEGRCGSPTITILLQREGHQVSERTIGKYMRELGLRSAQRSYMDVNIKDSKQSLPIVPNRSHLPHHKKTAPRFQ
ncbi:hypothetical protein GCM10010912_05630 [Paenibacillus albidus]|uniref:HTH-like domain-containing protein n=1 Tax=Paenibacillus albidus TaxID=2041023 RepID=A0A917FAW8_9BACL|nr:IS3 family transposase [Paenibacillus albidus]GGF63420.1 hypothetical protein GCM10010912_05630 [Paenibacillus albidus]